jgi:hypothetical protein
MLDELQLSASPTSLGKSLRFISHLAQRLKVNGHPGQFATTLTLSKDVGIALKGHGGAPSGYQSIITYLKTIEAILLSRYTSKGDGRSYNQANAIQTQAQSLGKSITGFGENVE